MDEQAKKTALRMIPYGLYILTSVSKDGDVSAAAINWVTQASFNPPLVAVAVKVDSGAHHIIKESGAFALNMLGKGQQELAFTFFKPQQREEMTIGGQPFRFGSTGVPVLEKVPAYLECKLVDTLEKGDHSIFLGEVVDAGLNQPIEGRPDEAILWLKELGEKIFYGG